MSRRRTEYSLTGGEITPAAPNLPEHDIHAAVPGVRSPADITEFALLDGKLCLPPIVDHYNGGIPTCTMGEHPDAGLVNRMPVQLRTAPPEGATPIIHSDAITDGYDG